MFRDDLQASATAGSEFTSTGRLVSKTPVFRNQERTEGGMRFQFEEQANFIQSRKIPFTTCLNSQNFNGFHRSRYVACSERTCDELAMPISNRNEPYQQHYQYQLGEG
jgi:hypothetical protein